MSNLTSNQVGGYKATISNPNTSEEAKAHAQEVVEQADNEAGNTLPEDVGRNTSGVSNRILGGHKAALHNPNTSGEAKQRAQDVLDSAGASDEPISGTSNAATTGDDLHKTRVLAGYKATLKNPNTSEEAKEHAQEVLEGEGVM